MTVFLDTNVLLDVLLRRFPHAQAAATLWSLAEKGQLSGWISAISFSNAYYIIRKAEGREVAHEAMRLLRGVFQSVPLDNQILNQAIDSEIDDLEDAIQYFSAIRAGAAHLLTRNAEDFPAASGLSIVSPQQFLAVSQRGA